MEKSTYYFSSYSNLIIILIYTDKITVNKLLQPLLDSGEFTVEQIQTIHDFGIQVFSVGYDIGRMINPKWKPVLQLNEWGKIVEEFPSILHAARKTEIDYRHISSVVLGKRPTAGGFKWKFKNLSDYGIE